jgi:hypothetical protein
MFYIAQTRSMIRSDPDYKHAGKLTRFVDAVVSFALASDAYCGKVKGRRAAANSRWQFLRRGELTFLELPP